jgi:hypothetical protein
MDMQVRGVLAWDKFFPKGSLDARMTGEPRRREGVAAVARRGRTPLPASLGPTHALRQLESARPRSVAGRCPRRYDPAESARAWLGFEPGFTRCSGGEFVCLTIHKLMLMY